jgi:hypothetical protein
VHPAQADDRAGNLLAEARRVPGMAGTVDVHPDWPPVDARIRAEATDNWNDQVVRGIDDVLAHLQ